MKKKRIGLYGGTFSPPHMGHYRALEAFIRQERPAETLVMPTYLPPHKVVEKGQYADPYARLLMSRIAFRDLPVTVSDFEIMKGGTSYTAETLTALKKPDTEIVFLCGTDMFLSMDTWYQPEKLFSLAQIVYARRDAGSMGDAIATALSEKAAFYQREYGAVVRELVCDSVDLSSTEIRRAIQNEENTDNCIHSRVRGYIDLWRLYRN